LDGHAQNPPRVITLRASEGALQSRIGINLTDMSGRSSNLNRLDEPRKWTLSPGRYIKFLIQHLLKSLRCVSYVIIGEARAILHARKVNPR